MTFGEFFRNRSHVAQTIFIVIILYAVSSINVLILTLGIVPYLMEAGAYFDITILVAFAFISLGTVLAISAYHLYTMISRKKRKSDAGQFERQAA